MHKCAHKQYQSAQTEIDEAPPTLPSGRVPILTATTNSMRALINSARGGPQLVPECTVNSAIMIPPKSHRVLPLILPSKQCLSASINSQGAPHGD